MGSFTFGLASTLGGDARESTEQVVCAGSFFASERRLSLVQVHLRLMRLRNMFCKHRQIDTG
jgi:hypothetical protein